MTGASGFKLRPYQERMVSDVKAEWELGTQAVALAAPTGAGKTAMACHLMRETVRSGGRAWFVAHLLTLTDQTLKKFREYGVNAGLIQAGNSKNKRRHSLICSVQTLEARDFARLGELECGEECMSDCDGKVCASLYMEEFDLGRANLPDLLVLDECHQGYRYARRLARAVVAKGGRVLGLSATPYAEWMSLSYGDLVPGASTKTLIEGGALVPFTVMKAEPLYREGGLKRRGDDFTMQSMQSAFEIVGDMPREWVAKTKEFYGGPVKTLVAAPTIAIGEKVAQLFNTYLADHADPVYQGLRFEVSSAEDGKGKRPRTAQILKRFDTGTTVGLVSVQKLAIGFDRPEAQCLVLARPFASITPFVQWVGRVLRTYPGKNTALLLDHAGNFDRLSVGFIKHMSEGPQGFEPVPEPGAKKDRNSVEWGLCDECNRPYALSRRVPSVRCPGCRAADAMPLDMSVVKGEMREVQLAFGDVDGRTWVLQESNTERLWYELSCGALLKFDNDYDLALRHALLWFNLLRTPRDHYSCELEVCRAGETVRRCVVNPPLAPRSGHSLHHRAKAVQNEGQGTHDVKTLLKDALAYRDELLAVPLDERPDIETIRCARCGRFAPLSEMSNKARWHDRCTICRRGK